METIKGVEVDFHSDNGFGPGHAAINVKVRDFGKVRKLRDYFDRLGVTDDEFDMLVSNQFDFMSEIFWQEDAQDIAKEFGFSKVYSEGRSGGWLAPVPYLSFDDLLDKETRKNFVAFRKRIEAIVEDAPNMLFESMAEVWRNTELYFLEERSVTVRAIKAWNKYGW